MRRAALALLLVACAAQRPEAAPADATTPVTRAEPAPTPPEPTPWDGATQLVLVTTEGWDDTTARLQRYEREAAGWRPVGAGIPAVLGRAGLAWGRGLHGAGAPAGRPGPVKVEGDGRSTAGVFRLGRVHGRDPAPPVGTRAAYGRLRESWRCVDDPRSRRYNQVFDSAGVEKDWSSAEDLWATGFLYDLLVVVDHNQPPVGGAGSCIFLHVWRGPADATAGCTAMDKRSLAELIAWMRPGEAIYLALPRDELSHHRRRWRLP